MGLSSVWLQTLGDGLIRADQIVGVHARRTPAITGKPSHWLLNVVLPLSTGSGQPDTWVTSPLHRTLIQTSHEPLDAPEHRCRYHSAVPIHPVPRHRPWTPLRPRLPLTGPTPRTGALPDSQRSAQVCTAQIKETGVPAIE